MNKKVWPLVALVLIVAGAWYFGSGASLKGSFYNQNNPRFTLKPADNTDTSSATNDCPDGKSLRVRSFELWNATKPILLDYLQFSFKGDGLKTFDVKDITLKINDSMLVSLSTPVTAPGVISFNLKEKAKYGIIDKITLNKGEGAKLDLYMTGELKAESQPGQPGLPGSTVPAAPIEVSATYAEGHFVGTDDDPEGMKFSDTQAPAYKVYMSTCGGQPQQASNTSGWTEPAKPSGGSGSGGTPPPGGSTPQSQPGAGSSPSPQQMGSSGAATPVDPYLPLPAGTYVATKGIPGIGTPVLAKWKNGFRWYTGKIADYKEVNGTYLFDIDYDDGDKEKELSLNQITYWKIHPKWVTSGQKVVIYSNDSKAYWSAHVISYKGGWVTITYDDEPTKKKTVDLSVIWVPLEE